LEAGVITLIHLYESDREEKSAFELSGPVGAARTPTVLTMAYLVLEYVSGTRLEKSEFAKRTH